MTEARLRFAPSPTGYLHIGGLRTALYNHFFAKHNKGKFILRIEDTDQTRYVEGAIENLIESLEWSGVTYDEGVFLEDGEIVERGDYGPYIQSKRLDIYKKYVDQLIEFGDAYYCFCSRDRLDKLREEQRIKGMVPKYDGFCRSIPLEEAKERVASGEEHVVRLKLPRNKDISFTDIIRGKITINSDDTDDQVLLKSDGFPTYHMAVVVDDHLMKITHIVRGEEWLASVPKHVCLYEALGWEVPVFAHLPTVLNKDRQKLSKRHGDVSVDDFKDKGYLPEGLTNYLALVGWSPEGTDEILTMDEMTERFTFERVSKTGGIFDRDKLDWVNGHYIRSEPLSRITDLAIPYMKEAGLIDDAFVQENREWLEILVDIVREGMSRMSEIVEKVAFIFDNEIKIEDGQAMEMIKTEGVPAIIEAMRGQLAEVDQIDQDFADGFMKKVQEASGVKGKNLFMPSRVALTGSARGPEFAKVLYLLGKENVLARLDHVEKTYL